MKTIFKDYLDIFIKFPKKDYLTKQQRKERYALLENYKKTTHQDEVTIDEFQNFIDSRKEEISVSPQLIEKFSKVLKKDIDDGELKALKFLIGDGDDSSYAVQFHQVIHKEFQNENVYSFTDKILEKDSGYLPAIRQKYKLLLNYLEFSIHEIPWGILDGNIMAEKEALPIMLNNLEEFSELSSKLGKNNEKFINMCKIYYTAWGDYLMNKDKSMNLMRNTWIKIK